MGYLNREKNHKSNLPAPYENPWYSLRKDLRAIISDLGLRARELLRRNNEGSLPYPKFLSSNISIYFWPFLLLILFTLLLFLSVFIYQPFSSNGLLEHIDSAKDLDSEEIKEDFDLSIIENTLHNRISEPNQFNSYRNTQIKLPLKVDPLIMSIINDDAFFNDIDKTIFDGSDVTSLDNGVLIKVGIPWKKVALYKREMITQNLFNQLALLGYDDLQLYDDNGFLLARKSKLGKEMILFERE